MIKVKMTCNMSGDTLYCIDDVVSLDDGVAKSWVEAGVAMYLDDQHPIATKIGPPRAKKNGIDPAPEETAKEVEPIKELDPVAGEEKKNKDINPVAKVIKTETAAIKPKGTRAVVKNKSKGKR